MSRAIFRTKIDENSDRNGQLVTVLESLYFCCRIRFDDGEEMWACDSELFYE